MSKYNFTEFNTTSVQTWVVLHCHRSCRNCLALKLTLSGSRWNMCEEQLQPYPTESQVARDCMGRWASGGKSMRSAPQWFSTENIACMGEAQLLHWVAKLKSRMALLSLFKVASLFIGVFSFFKKVSRTFINIHAMVLTLFLCAVLCLLCVYSWHHRCYLCWHHAWQRVLTVFVIILYVTLLLPSWAWPFYTPPTCLTECAKARTRPCT